MQEKKKGISKDLILNIAIQIIITKGSRGVNKKKL